MNKIKIKEKPLEEQRDYLLEQNMLLTGKIATLEKENVIFKKANEIIAQQRDDRDADISKLENQIEDLEAQIEKMKCCGNCKYWFCNKSSISIDENENRTVHKWNEEKQAYCDVGIKGKYQCWELAE